MVAAGIVTAVVISKSGQKSITFEVTYKDETNDTITVKSKKDSSEKDKDEETFYTYCYKGKWYRNTSVLDYVVRALNTRERLAGTDDSGDDGWG